MNGFLIFQERVKTTKGYLNFTLCFTDISYSAFIFMMLFLYVFSEPFWHLASAGTPPSSIMPHIDVVFKIKACMKRAHVRMLSSNIRDSFICEVQKHEASSYQTFLCLVEAIHQRQQSLVRNLQME